MPIKPLAHILPTSILHEVAIVQQFTLLIPTTVFTQNYALMAESGISFHASSPHDNTDHKLFPEFKDRRVTRLQCSRAYPADRFAVLSALKALRKIEHNIRAVGGYGVADEINSALSPLRAAFQFEPEELQ